MHARGRLRTSLRSHDGSARGVDARRAGTRRSAIGGSCSRAGRSRGRPVALRRCARSAPNAAWCSVSGAAPDRCRPRRDADVVEWDLPPAVDVPASIRAEERLFGDPPPPFVDALARFDPQGDALVLPPPFAALYERRGAARVRRAPGGVGRARGQDRGRRPVRGGGGGRRRRSRSSRPSAGRSRAAARRASTAARARYGRATRNRDSTGDRLRALGRRRRRRRGRDRAARVALRAGPRRRRSSRGSRAACTGSSPTTGSPCSGPSS